MESVFLLIHLFLAVAIIGLVLIQRSEGGGLGIGGGTGGGLTTASGAKSILTRATAICAACFFCTSLILGIFAGTHTKDGSMFDQVSTEISQSAAEDVGADAKTEDTESAADADKAPAVPISE